VWPLAGSKPSSVTRVDGDATGSPLKDPLIRPTARIRNATVGVEPWAVIGELNPTSDPPGQGR
jgi:hypothetical protein